MPLLTEGIVAFRNAASAATTHNATQPFGAHIQTQQYAVLQVSFFFGGYTFPAGFGEAAGFFWCFVGHSVVQPKNSLSPEQGANGSIRKNIPPIHCSNQAGEGR